MRSGSTPPTSRSRIFGNGSSSVSATAPAIDTNWHHIVATYDEATAKVYVDGVLKASANSNIQLTANSQPLLIGRTTDNNRIFGGTLDEVAVYPTALSAARIQAHYTAATSVDTTPPAVTLTTPSRRKRRRADTDLRRAGRHRRRRPQHRDPADLQREHHRRAARADADDERERGLVVGERLARARRRHLHRARSSRRMAPETSG